MNYSKILQDLLDFFPHTLSCCILTDSSGKIELFNKSFALFFADMDEPFLGNSLFHLLNKKGVKYADFILTDPPDGKTRTFTIEERTFVAFRKLLSHGDFGLDLSEDLSLVFWAEIPYQHGEKYELLLHEFEIILDSIHDGIWIIDGNGITRHANKSMKRIAGIKSKDVVGKHVTVPMLEGKFTSCVSLEALRTRKTVTQFDDYSNGNRCLNTSTPIISEKGEVERVVASIRDLSELKVLQDKVAQIELEASRYKGELAKLEQCGTFVGNSPVFAQSLNQLKKVARASSCVLILGETGTGKSLAASYIHENSDRKGKPFISINCAAIAESLIDSELFGYQKGAFTGADPQGKKGYFELANGGTLLLDEIGELPLSMQAKLLHVLDNYSFHKVGGSTAIKVNVRIIAATNRSLEELVKTGGFRKDLFYRLHVLTVSIPPLRERSNDIPLLANAFLAEACCRLGTAKIFHKKALLALTVYDWPGNVRELRGAVEYLVAMSEGDTIKVSDISPHIIANSTESLSVLSKDILKQGETDSFYKDCDDQIIDVTDIGRNKKELADSDVFSSENFDENSEQSFLPDTVFSSVPTLKEIPKNLNEAVAELEKYMISNALMQGGSTYKAAAILGVSQSTVVRKAKALGLRLSE